MTQASVSFAQRTFACVGPSTKADKRPDARERKQIHFEFQYSLHSLLANTQQCIIPHH